MLLNKEVDKTLAFTSRPAIVSGIIVKTHGNLRSACPIDYSAWVCCFIALT